MTLISVDLPAPLSPMSPTISLRPTERSMSRSACTAPKYFCTPSRRTMDAKSPAGVIAFPTRNHFGSARDDPKRLLPQNNPHGKQRPGLAGAPGSCRTKYTLRCAVWPKWASRSSSSRVRPDRGFTPPGGRLARGSISVHVTTCRASPHHEARSTTESGPRGASLRRLTPSLSSAVQIRSQESTNPSDPIRRGHAPLLPIDRHQRRGHGEVEIGVKGPGHPRNDWRRSETLGS